MARLSPIFRFSVFAVLAVLFTACGGSGAGSNAPSSPVAVSHQTPLLIRDAPSEDWASVAVKVNSIVLVSADNTRVSVYQPTMPALVNLAQLDQIADQLASAVPPGTYAGAVISIAANPGDVLLTVSQDPEAGFAGSAGTTIPSDQIVIAGATGSAGAMTVDIPIQFRKSLTVSSSQSTPVEIDFNLGHPAFVIDHSVTGGVTIYTVSFKGGMVSQRPVSKITDVVLRHMYGMVSTIASDNLSVVLGREVPALPLQVPAQSVSLGISTTIRVDADHGTLYYDLDHTVTPSTLRDFSSVAADLPTRHLRVEARYQPDGSLIATRIFAATAFDQIWRSPEGHVLRINPSAQTITVSGEDGTPQVLTVDDATQFVLPNQPASAAPIGTGAGFLGNLHRGFKVHVTVDPANATLARIVEIETAGFSGKIANATSGQFDIVADYRHHGDGYSITLPYVSNSSVTGIVADGVAVNGFSYWNFAYPTEVTYTHGTVDAIQSFVAATNGSIGFGGLWGTISARGETHAVWGDPSAPSGWSSPWVELTPSRLPLAFVSAAVTGNQFSVALPAGLTPVTVTFNTTPGSATLVYGVGRTHDQVSIAAQDVTTADGLAALTAALSLNRPVRISGIPQSDGTLKAYVITYFTGTDPNQ